MSVGSSVGVGVRVMVGVSVGVTAGSAGVLLPRRIRKTTYATMARNTTRKPRAAGRLSLISGICVPWIDFWDFGLVSTVNSLPQTTQRVAFSARRVPQVGQSLVEVVSGLIRRAIIPRETFPARPLNCA